MTVEPQTWVRPRLRRFAMVALALLTPITAWTIWDYVEARRLAGVVDEIRAKGDPVSIVPAAHVPGGPGKAARYHQAAAALPFELLNP